MKLFFTLAFSIFLIYCSTAQNVGIGINTPRAKLHVFGGTSGNNSPFSPLVVESNTNTYINLLSPEANETSILFGKPSNAASGGIIYNNTSTVNGFQFRTNGNTTRMVIRNDGNVGIGTLSPNAPLGFPPFLGKKITLYPGATGDVGLAVQGNLLQIYADHPNADIAFGYDQAGVFTERFRMKANGAFMVNGNAGSAGQVLQSNGDGNIPAWTLPTNLLYSNTIMLQSTSDITPPDAQTYDLPGLSHSFTANSNTKVLVTFSIQTETISCFACGTTNIGIYMFVDGSLSKYFFNTLANGIQQNLSGTTLVQLAPGPHTIAFKAARGGPNAVIGSTARASNVVLQIIPQ